MAKNSIALAICSAILVLLIGGLGVIPAEIPPLKVHPLPPTLSQWQDSSNSGDYFAEIKITPVGYLVWSDFPIEIYAQKGEDRDNRDRVRKWVESILQAIEEWNVYLPLQVVNTPENADIKIWRSRPPLQATRNPSTGRLELPRARAAETRYEFYLRKSSNSTTVLSQRFNIFIGDNQAPNYILPSIRHELGHALGIWGHSPLETDALYFSQVRNSPPISVRDINTLKRIYEQPTRLGWELPN